VSAGQRRFDAVIFDNDGLLLDTEVAWTRAERALFERYGRVFSAENKRDLLGSSRATAAGKLEVLLAQAGRGDELYEEMTELVLIEVGIEAEPQPGALELLAALRAAGVPLGLASNSPRRFVDLALATAGIRRDTFAATFAGDEVAHPKPAPDIYRAVAEALGIECGRAAVFEDSPTGVAAARAAGCYVVGVPSLEGITLAGADLVVESLGAGAVYELLGLAA
jgi:HAD superfamily hydrolase (TIGR01509 family)